MKHFKTHSLVFGKFIPILFQMVLANKVINLPLQVVLPFEDSHTELTQPTILIIAKF